MRPALLYTVQAALNGKKWIGDLELCCFAALLDKYTNILYCSEVDCNAVLRNDLPIFFCERSVNSAQ